MTLIGLRVDVDTHEGMRDGVPKLLEIFRDAGVRASFFFSMGPDNAGRAIFNFLKPGFLAKMLRTGAPGLYGWRTILSGTLLPARPIGTAFRDLIEQSSAEGHEVGVHCWDHRLWQDSLDDMSVEVVCEQLDRGFQEFKDIAGQPTSFAAPAWLTRPEALVHQESLGLMYASDCRGIEPFLPCIDGRTLSTPQVPANMATLDEVLGRPGHTAQSFFSDSLEHAEALEWPVFTLHSEAEGGPYAPAFRSFLESGKSRGFGFAPLGAVLAQRVESGPLPTCKVERGTLEGRHGVVSVQGVSQ